MTDVVVVVRPAATTAWVDASGATAPIVLMPAMAVASSTVRVDDPPFRPEALIVRRFVPRAFRRVVVLDVVPCPTPTRAPIRARPMPAPDIVRARLRRQER